MDFGVAERHSGKQRMSGEIHLRAHQRGRPLAGGKEIAAVGKGKGRGPGPHRGHGTVPRTQQRPTAIHVSIPNLTVRFGRMGRWYPKSHP